MQLLRDWIRGPLTQTGYMTLGAALGAPAAIVACQMLGIWPVP